MDDDDVLAARWAAAVPGADAAAAAAALADLRGRYGEPHRHYHTLVHVAVVLEALDVLGSPGPAVPLAAWYHDAVYDVTAAGNEAASAELARAVLPGLGVDAATVAETARLVELTGDHAVADGDLAGAVLVDADLCILGAPPAVYDRYAGWVRAEYAHVPDERWRVGRAQVLAGFAARPVLFHTPAGRDLWEAPARANLARERASLRPRPGPADPLDAGTT